MIAEICGMTPEARMLRSKISPVIVLYIRAKLADSPVYQSMNDALESKGAASADGQIAAKVSMAGYATLMGSYLEWYPK